jgi:serine/threonine protein kinase
MASEPQFVRMYDFQENLGKGHFAVVKRAQHVISKEQVAVKIIDKLKLNKDELGHIHHEACHILPAHSICIK